MLHVLLILLNLQKFHHLEEGRRKRVVALLLLLHIHLRYVEFNVFPQTHELLSIKNRHIVITQHYHIAYLMRRIVQLHPSPIHEQLVYLKTPVLNLLICLLTFAQNRPRLRIVITSDSLEIILSILVTLMNDGYFVDESRSCLT